MIAQILTCTKTKKRPKGEHFTTWVHFYDRSLTHCCLTCELADRQLWAFAETRTHSRNHQRKSFPTRLQLGKSSRTNHKRKTLPLTYSVYQYIVYSINHS